jgi:energy-coupling factor transporter ATP-binding protein EcfA2
MKNRRIDLILGKTGSGKSSFVKKELIPYRKRLVIIDALSEYENGVIFYNIDNFIEYIIENKVNQFRRI